MRHDVRGSGDIPIATSLRIWIAIKSSSQFVYSIHLQVVIPWSPQAVLRFGPCVLMFYTCPSQGVYIAGQSDSECLQYMKYLYYIGYVCYVMPPDLESSFELKES